MDIIYREGLYFIENVVFSSDALENDIINTRNSTVFRLYNNEVHSVFYLFVKYLRLN